MADTPENDIGEPRGNRVRVVVYLTGHEAGFLSYLRGQLGQSDSGVMAFALRHLYARRRAVDLDQVEERDRGMRN